MRCVFLLGSGISIGATMPSVGEITKQVISGEGASLHTDQTFVLVRGKPHYDLGRQDAERVLALVNDLRSLAAAYFGREPDYEEISLLARQLADAVSREYESAALTPLVTQLLERPYALGDRHKLGELSELAHRYVADTVRQMLGKTPSRLNHLGAIVEACRRLARVDLATLNHDLVLETALEAGGVAYADGFEQTDEDVRRWEDDWGDRPIRLLKLHGSLDWWSYQFADEPWRGWVTSRYRGADPINPNRLGVVGLPHDLRPVLLTGTFDKILAYETWIFPDQHFRFHEALRDTRRIVAIGYGFGDKAINTRLIGWLARARENKLIVCHRDPDRVAARARGAIRSRWVTWLAQGRLAVVPAHVGELDFEALAAHL